MTTLINEADVDTLWGIKRFELHHTDITAVEEILGEPVDILVFSTMRGSLAPIRDTVVKALRDRGIDLDHERSNCALDLRSALNTWVSHPLIGAPCKRLVCVELDFNSQVGERQTILDNLFLTIMLLEARGIPVRHMALPILGTGKSMFKLQEMTQRLLELSSTYFEKIEGLRQILFCAIDQQDVDQINEWMDETLGRKRIFIARGGNIDYWEGEIKGKVHELRNCTISDAFRRTIDDLVNKLDDPNDEARLTGVAARRFLEAFTLELNPTSKDDLDKRIRAWNKQFMSHETLMQAGLYAKAYGNRSTHYQPTQINAGISDQVEYETFLHCFFQVAAFATYGFSSQMLKSALLNEPANS